jgi:hypothetical protein
MSGISSLLLGIVFALTSAAAPADASDRSAAAFCAALALVNDGKVDTQGLTELEAVARVAETLRASAPPAIERDLVTLHETVAAWADGTTGRMPMARTFAVLTDPGFAGVQGRIADYIAEQCDLRLGTGEYRVASDAIRAGRCPAWPRVGSPLTFNHFPNLPDIAGGNYFANDFWLGPGDPPRPGMFEAEPGGWAVFHGQYPRARYFAYHPNDQDLNNLKTLRDVDLDPDAGSVNPFREPAKPGSRNTYTAKLVFDIAPAEPEANTAYVGAKKDGIHPNFALTNLLRLYASDLGDGPNSGGVPLPAVTIFGADGKRQQHFPECEPYVEGEDPPRTDILFPSLPIADPRPQATPTWSTSSNFEAPSDTLANADVQYLATHFSRRFGDIFVVRGKFATTPNSRGGEPVSAKGKDARLWTLCVYNFWSGAASDCMLDHEARIDADGFYTIVVSERENRPANLEAQSASWLDWGAFLDGQLTYRMVYREDPLVRRIAFALNGGRVDAATRAYVPVATPCTKARFEAEGWQGCLAGPGR